MILIKRFLCMLQFLTRIPINYHFELDNENYGKALVFAPLIGALIGLMLCVCYLCSSYVFNQEISALLVVVFYIFITGGLHIDGLGDTFDGLFSNRSKERMLEIMKDSRVGTNAVIIILIVLLTDIILIKNIPNNYVYVTIFLMPVAGRIGSLTASAISKYARIETGMGKSFVDYCNTKELIVGFSVGLFIFYIAYKYVGLIIAVASLVSAIVITKSLSKKIDGVTGDVLGAICELNQTTFLLLMYFSYTLQL